MPYTIKKRDCKQSDGDSGEYVLVKDKGDSEEQVSCHTSKTSAEGSRSARYANKNEQTIREFIRGCLTLEASGGRVLDVATNQISRSVVEMLKDSNVRSRHSDLRPGDQLQFRLQDADEGSGGVDSDLVNIDTIGNIVVFLEATDDELWTAGAYQYNPDDRSNSDLIVALGLPRGYDLRVLSLVIPDVKEAVRHELEHGTQSTEVLQNRDEAASGDHFRSKESLVSYYTQGGETGGHVTGLYKKAKDMKVPIPLIINDYLTGIFQRAIQSGMEESAADDATKQIAMAWYDYLVDRYPESRRFLSH